MSDSAVLKVFPLGFPWETFDPFLFCVLHDDDYPAGNEDMGPAASLEGRDLGQDFVVKDGWRMYHGMTVPGFPGHPHRGFETVTIVRKGLIDHADSLQAAARFGQGDVQWLTAGKGIVHSEMFPLLHRNARNPLELFQIWLNLAAADKMAEPHFTMLWNHQIPRHEIMDEAGRSSAITIVAGTLADHRAPAPPPRSWAARAESHVAIWTLKMAPGARLTLPAAVPGLNRSLYFFRGASLNVNGRALPPYHGARLRSEAAATLEAGAEEVELLMLQGKPIAEPVAQYGPFVMNTRVEIQQAMMDYQRTQFGGWPWPSQAPTHPREAGRFARHADGRIERQETDLD